MSRTYRKYHWGCFRNPRGRKQAEINNVRFKATPPDAYDDIRHNHEVYIPISAGRKMIKRGMAPETMKHRLMKKFNLSYRDASRMMDWWIKVWTNPKWEYLRNWF